MASTSSSRLKSEAARIGLSFNETKSKYLFAVNPDQLGSSVLVYGDNFEVVKELCYLGTVVTSDNDISSEIRGRIVQGLLWASPIAEIQKTSNPHET